MKSSINEAIASTVTDMLEADLKVSFTKKELDKLGVNVAPVSILAESIQNIRKVDREAIEEYIASHGYERFMGV